MIRDIAADLPAAEDIAGALLLALPYELVVPSESCFVGFGWREELVVWIVAIDGTLILEFDVVIESTVVEV